MEPMRVLVFGMTENPGGVESFLKNYYRQIHKESIQFDFLCNSYNPIAYEEEFQEWGARTFHFPPRHSHPFGFRHLLRKFFAEHAHEYAAIWVNVNSLANIDYLKLAKRYGIACRIIHSHNSENMDSGMMGKLRGFLHQANKKKVADYATDFWACSEGAADYFYSGELRNRAIVIHNAIDVKRMAFDADGRKKHRDQIGADENTIVLGNVGRLHFQKNQRFLLDWFASFVAWNMKETLAGTAKLVLIGAGEDEEMLRAHTDELGLGDKVYFVGLTDDVRGWMSAMDVFAFPSLFEGVSLVGLEAQANGLPIMASKTAIPAEAIVFADRIRFADLADGEESWATDLAAFLKEMKLNGHEMPADSIAQAFTASGYDISVEVKKLEDFFEQHGRTDSDCGSK